MQFCVSRNPELGLLAEAGFSITQEQGLAIRIRRYEVFCGPSLEPAELSRSFATAWHFLITNSQPRIKVRTILRENLHVVV